MALMKGPASSSSSLLWRKKRLAPMPTSVAPPWHRRKGLVEIARSRDLPRHHRSPRRWGSPGQRRQTRRRCPGMNQTARVRSWCSCQVIPGRRWRGNDLVFGLGLDARRWRGHRLICGRRSCARYWSRNRTASPALRTCRAHRIGRTGDQIIPLVQHAADIERTPPRILSPPSFPRTAIKRPASIKSLARLARYASGR